ncbi:hypothetical protein GCM10023194_32610 [Planotetraspora phitsanulokensis]|uniref:Uncharacterized protein n=1 Tax=Planotetraspora phitsanulokensis TaxID=575192 RepID=A0A8J3XC23_9ACTN|nr:hypothetical protein Pph01_06030 [Planotetraspora phitsanulokensis]
MFSIWSGRAPALRHLFRGVDWRGGAEGREVRSGVEKRGCDSCRRARDASLPFTIDSEKVFGNVKFQ